MSDAAVAALSALGGAFIGSLGGAVAAILAYKQAKGTRESEDRRHIWQLGLELGLKEWQNQIADAQKQGGRIWPPQVYAYFSGRFLQLATSVDLNPATYDRLDKEVLAMARAVRRRRRCRRIHVSATTTRMSAPSNNEMHLTRSAMATRRGPRR